MALKPKLQLRHKGAGEVRNRIHHQGNLQEPNEAPKSKEEGMCTTKVKAIGTGLPQPEPVGSHIMLPHGLDVR